MDLAFDHLGVVNKSLELGRKTLTEMLAITHWTNIFRGPANGVAVQFGVDRSGICYELLEPLDENSPVFSALIGRSQRLQSPMEEGRFSSS